MNAIPHLLQPGRIGSLEVKNRIIYGPMTFKLGDHKGRLTEAEVNSMLYRAKQEYGPGMIIFPGLLGSVMEKPVSAINLNTDDAMFSLMQQTARFKTYNVKTVAEIGILGAREDGVSDGASNMQYPIAFREMHYTEIQKFEQQMADMAGRAKKAGFDAVYIQTAVSKKILGNFISPYTNHRQDAYGGSTENRARIVIETLQAMRQQVGNDYPILLDLRVDELLGSKGIELEEGIRLASLVAPYVDALIPSVGCEFSLDNVYAPYFTKAGYMFAYTEALKKALPDMTVIACSKLGEPTAIEEAATLGQFDFAELGRPLFVDPQWIGKAVRGETAEIARCIGCLNCYTETSRKEIYPMQRCCTVNPANLREDDYYQLKLAMQPKKILVVGGGLAGMEAAATLAKRGHRVQLCEKSERLGGQFYVASQEAEKVDYRTLIPYKQAVLEHSGAEVCLQTVVYRAYLKEYAPDIVVLATGAVPKTLPYQKTAHVNIVQGNDVILEQAKVGNRVVVIGGRFIGLSVASKLAMQGKQVSVVDMVELGKGANPRLIKYYNQKLIEYRACLYPNSPVLNISDAGVDIQHLNFPVTLPADTVVLAIGTKPVDNLKADLEILQIPYVCIGDCKRIGDALYAVRDGAEVGRML